MSETLRVNASTNVTRWRLILHLNNYVTGDPLLLLLFRDKIILDIAVGMYSNIINEGISDFGN